MEGNMKLKLTRWLRLLTVPLVLATLLVIPLGQALATAAYNVDWVVQFGTSGSDHINDVTTDGLGFAYAAGDTPTAFPGETWLGQSDAFVTRYNNAGGLEWVREFGTNLTERAEGVAGDSLGNSWVVGDTYGELVDGINYDGCDAFIRKYNSIGTAQWTDQFGTTNHCYARDVAVDSTGNTYVVGYVGASLDGQTFLLGYDAFIRKYNNAGVKQWTREFGTGSSDLAYAVAVDAYGNSYVAGKTGGTFPGEIQVGLDDGFVRKYNSDGDAQWTCQFGTNKADEVHGIAIDGAGNIYTAGYTKGQFAGETASGGTNDAFLSKLTSDGITVLWSRQFGSGVDTYAFGAAVDGMGNAYIAGYTDGALPGQTSMGNSDAYVRQYESTGYAQWTYQYGAMDGANAGEDYSYGVATDGSQNVFTGGWTNGQYPGYPDKSYDGYIMKMVPQPPTPSQVWFLNNLTTGPVMTQTGTVNGSVLIEGGTTVTWLSDQSASTDVVFDDGSWRVLLSTFTLTGTYQIQIGEWDGAVFTPFHTAITGTASGVLIDHNINLDSVTVPQDHYLALQVTNSGTGSIITDGGSYLQGPSSTPSYPVPEMATIILLGLGLAGLTAFIIIHRKRTAAKLTA
jgi:hypothetical protein